MGMTIMAKMGLWRYLYALSRTYSFPFGTSLLVLFVYHGYIPFPRGDE